MRKEVEEGEEDGEWLLDPKEAVEWPFPMELNDRIEHWWVTRQAPVGDDLLTCVVTFGRARPKEESEVEGLKAVSMILSSDAWMNYDAYVRLNPLFCSCLPCTPIIVNMAPFPDR